jgi:transcriptional regulator with XRE-family HTH domain
MLPVQCRMARAALGLSVKKLAVAARVAPQTIVRFERGEKIRPRTGTVRRPSSVISTDYLLFSSFALVGGSTATSRACESSLTGCDQDTATRSREIAFT